MRKSILISLLASAAISSAAVAAGEPESGQHKWQRSAQASNSDDSPRAERSAGRPSRGGAGDKATTASDQPRVRAERSWTGGNGGGWGVRSRGSIATQGSVASQGATPSTSGFDERLKAYRERHQRTGDTVGAPGSAWRSGGVSTTTPQTVRPDHRAGGPRHDWSSTDWRRDSRYDWNRYRDRHRSIFRVGIYYDPYGYNYRRFNIGYSMWPNYYQSSYWINDPWMYRLPPVYGPYRWVRYWDDALLVDIFSGEVVDVIHNFFW